MASTLANNRLMMFDELRLGLIGAGRWGRNYISTIQNIDGARLARLCSSNPESANLCPQDCSVSPDWRSVARANDLDGLIIATPPELHAKMALAAIDAGIPVLIEKPLTLDSAEAEVVLALAKEKKIPVHVDHIHVYAPAFRKLKSCGMALGPIHAIRSGAGNRGPVRSDASVLWDWGPHDVAMCIDLLGVKPEQVSARILERRRMETGYGESIAIHLVFPGNISADIEISNLLESRKRFFAVHYDHDTLIYDDVGVDKLVQEPRPDSATCLPETAETIPVDDTLPLECVVKDFCQSVRHADSDITGLELGLDVVETLKACERVLEKGIS